MIDDAKKIIDLIKPLFQSYKIEIQPANKDVIIKFSKKLKSIGMPEKVINELTDFYSVTNGRPCLDVNIFKTDDDIIFEWWKSQGALWLGQKDMDVLTWKDGQYQIGCTGNLVYGDEYLFPTFYEMLKKGFDEWF